MNALQQKLEAVAACPDGLVYAAQFETFAELWNAIERTDWIFWLVRHCPDEFENSLEDMTSAAHGLAQARELDIVNPDTEDVSVLEIAAFSCQVVRDYVRLKARP